MKQFKLMLALSAFVSLPLAAQAQSTQAAAPAAKLAQTSTVMVSTLSLQAAQHMAMKAVAQCAAAGYHVAATVVDHSGVALAMARSENAGPHTVGASLGKAFTSASGKNPTSEMAKNLANNPGLADIPGYLVLAGGVPVRVGTAVVGAVGVGGAPSGMIDEKCADEAIKSVLRP